jgi:hypothetical protein
MVRGVIILGELPEAGGWSCRRRTTGFHAGREGFARNHGGA